MTCKSATTQMLTLALPPQLLESFASGHAAIAQLFTGCDSCSSFAEGLSVFHAPLHAAHVLPTEFLPHVSV
jgi:hypothetical protein